MKRNLRIGVAGLGFGGSVHIPAFLSLPGVKVAAIAGKHIEKTKVIARRYHIENSYADLEKFFEQDLDMVSLALPPIANERALTLAFQKKIPVLSEKPLASSAKAALKFAHQAHKTKNMPYMVDFQFLELPAFRKLKRILEEKKLGHIRYGQLTWLVESYAQKKRLWSWKTDAASMGGAVSLLGSHFFFLVEWLLAPIKTLSASLYSHQTAKFTPHGKTPADDLAMISMTLRGDIPFAAIIGNASPGGIGHRWEIVFEKGTLILYNPTPDYMSGFRLSIRQKEQEKVIFADTFENDTDGRLRPFRSLARRFISAVREKKSGFPDFSAASRVQTLLEMVYNAARL